MTDPAPSCRSGRELDLQKPLSDGGESPLYKMLYLDQNYLSGFAKHKPAFRELEPVLRDAVAAGVVAVVESDMHTLESRPRPDLRLLELLRELCAGRRLPSGHDREAREVRRRMVWTIEHDLPERRPQASDRADLDALAIAVVHCDIVTCDAFMADVLRRARLDIRHKSKLFTGRRADVLRLRDYLERLTEHRGDAGPVRGV
jgi:hypothetical protein